MFTLEGLKNEGIITIVGHINADFDSVVSCIMMSRYLTFKGIKNQVKMLDSHVDEYLNLFDISIDEYEVGIKDEDVLFVVDSSFKFKNKIVGCIDHHKDEVNTNNYLYRPQTSCAKIIYDLMKDDGYCFSKDELKIICFSLFIDSCSFKNSKALKEDLVWAKEIIKENDFDFDWFYKNGLCLNDLSEPFESFCFYGKKEYFKEGISFCSSYIQVDKNSTEEFDMKCIFTIRAKMKEDNISLWVFLIQNVVDDMTKYLIISNNYVVIHNKVFSEEDKYLLSRGNGVIPRVLKEILVESPKSLVTKNLIDNNLSISTMESCTSGLIASNITDTEGASSILKGAFVTYSNEAKIKQGVPKEVIDNFGVYSYETSLEMAKQCSLAYNSNIGIGVTGTTGNLDKNNLDSVKGTIYFCVKINESYYLSKLILEDALSREQMKETISNFVLQYLYMLLEMPY